MPRSSPTCARLLAGLGFSLLGALASTWTGAAATPATVSVDFVGSHTAMGSSESAGVVAKTHWNSAAGASRSTPLSLVDETGATSGISVTWRADGTAATSITDAPGSRRMMKGYLNNSNGQPTTVTVSGLSSALTYTLYLYIDGNNSTATRTGTYQVSGNGLPTSSTSATDAANTNFSGTFVQANNSAGNYVRFMVQRVTSFTITATPGQADTSTRRAPLNGFQLVPASTTTSDFSVSATPASGSVAAGSSRTYTVTVGALSGFTGPVALAVSGLPSGATASFNPASINTSGTSTLTVTTSASTPPGSSTLTITGTSGSRVHAASVSMTVNGPASPDFSVSASPSSRTINQGSATTYAFNVSAANGFAGTVALTVSGLPSNANASFSPSSIANSGSSTLTVTTTGSTSTGTFTLTMKGTSGSLSHSTTTALVVSAPSNDPQPLGSSGSWVLSFRDEFDGASLDRSIWATTYNGGGRTNNDELEWYTDGDSTHVVSNGTLKLTALKQSSQAGFPYTSGMISSHNSFVQMYGFFEARMKLPAGRGFWPAFWLLPVHAWPPEIDTMESLGHDCTRVYMSNHWSVNWPTGVSGDQAGSVTNSYIGPNFCSGFHTYGVEWTPTTIDFYVDGVLRSRLTDHVPVANSSWTGMALIANLAVGGSWPGAPDSSTPFPSALEIDYIRAWRR